MAVCRSWKPLALPSIASGSRANRNLYLGTGLSMTLSRSLVLTLRAILDRLR